MDTHWLDLHCPWLVRNKNDECVAASLWRVFLGFCDEWSETYFGSLQNMGETEVPWREGRWFATCVLNNECMLIEAKQMSSKERFFDLERDSLSWSRAKFCSGQATFLRYDVKPFPVKYGRFSTWSIQSGLFAKACFWSSQSSWMFII